MILTIVGLSKRVVTKLAIWKSSEDQLMALEYVIQEEIDSELVKELYNQLKKL